MKIKISKLKVKAYREGLIEADVPHGIAFQITALRQQRGWTQKDLADKIGTNAQSTVSRLENPGYGKYSLDTLFKLAAAFDVALLVKFVPFSRYLKEIEDVSPQALYVKSFTDEFGDENSVKASSKAKDTATTNTEFFIVKSVNTSNPVQLSLPLSQPELAYSQAVSETPIINTRTTSGISTKRATA